MNRIGLRIVLATSCVALSALRASAADPAPSGGERDGVQVVLSPRPEPKGRASERLRALIKGPNALVVSGGSSLGVYEAGVLYYVTLVQASAPPHPGIEQPGFSVASGTSAGAINAFMSSVATCQQPNKNPRQSPFWLWTEVDWNELFARGQRDRNACAHLDGILTRAPIRAAVERLVKAWETSTWRACDVRFGAAVTYLHPLRLLLRDNSSIRVARLTERFAIRMQAEDGRAPTLTAIRGKNGEFPALGRKSGSVESSGRLAPEDVMELLMASSGVPGVFNPVPIQIVYEEGQQPEQRCAIDGGALDNVPLSTAIRLMGEVQAGGAGKPTYVYVDADNVEPGAVAEDKTPRPEPEKSSGAGMLPDLGELIDNLVTGARQAELARTITENKSIRESLELPQRKHFITGGLLNAFGAFFDQSFREYDFFAGMADAERSLSTLNEAAGGQAVGLPAVDAKEFPCFQAVWAAAGREAVNDALRGAACEYLRAPWSDKSPAASMRRDLWRLLALIGSGDLDAARPGLANAFLTELATAKGPPGAGWAPGYEYATLRLRGGPAGPQSGLAAVREQLQDLVDRASDRIRSGAGIAGAAYRPLLATAGNELANAALTYRRIPWSLSAGVYGRGGELALARMLTDGAGTFGIDAVGGVQLADYGFDRRSIPGYMDFRASLGPRAEFRPISPVQLLLGGSLVGQVGLSHRHRTLARTGWSIRGDVQLLERIYVGAAYTRFFDDADRWRTEDLSLALGFRFWLRGKR